MSFGITNFCCKNDEDASQNQALVKEELFIKRLTEYSSLDEIYGLFDDSNSNSSSSDESSEAGCKNKDLNPTREFSRPLTQLTDDPSDLNVLTPAHFLIGDSLLTTPEPNYQDVPINRLSRWQHIQNLFEHLWKRWSTEYLSQLQARTKLYSNSETRLKEGSMVILEEENLPPFKWKIGRIEKTFPGKEWCNSSSVGQNQRWAFETCSE
ncbi:hypothetical protein Trydic_g17602 [Trypoxylus dichotomus]